MQTVLGILSCLTAETQETSLQSIQHCVENEGEEKGKGETDSLLLEKYFLTLSTMEI